MAWVRYDDQFHNNAKVTAVVFDDPGAIGLHALANTWTNAQKHKGYVPAHQPGVLLCDKEKGRKWAAILVKHGLWHEVGALDCDACLAEYAGLPPFEDGYVFHNSREYRSPDRERQTPGTPADLSEKRRQAGRAGGKATAAKRNGTNSSTGKQTEAKHQEGPASQANPGDVNHPVLTTVDGGTAGTSPGTPDFGRPAQTQQTARANAANGASKTSNLPLAGVSPEPVPEPRDRTSVTHGQNPGEPDPPLPPVADNGDGDRDDTEAVLIDLPAARQARTRPAPKPGSDDDPAWRAFWAAYPRKVDKGHARTAWAKALKRAGPDTIVTAAEAYRDDPARPLDPQYIPHPATWLNGDRWLDEPRADQPRELPPRGGGPDPGGGRFAPNSGSRAPLPTAADIATGQVIL
jgi:hypothetical protein